MSAYKTVTEPEKSIPVAGEADVVVVGGGLAGVSAALAAARTGAKVLLLEKTCVLGGLATLGHVCVYLPLDDGAGHKIYGGQAEELLHTCIRYGYDDLPDCWRAGPDSVEQPTGRYRATFNIPAAICALDEALEEAGVEVVFDTAFCDVLMDGNAVRAVLAENKSGRCAYLAKMFVDASGDSDLLYRAGAQTETRGDNIVSHWAYELDLSDPGLQAAAAEKNVLKALRLRWLGLRPDRDNAGSEIPVYEGTSVEGVNGYIRTSRRLARDFIKANNRPGWAQLTLPTMPQFRMTRRLVGVKELEIRPGVSVPDSVGCVIFSLAAPAAVFEFPYGGLIDARVENVLAAGRMVSAGGKGWEIMRFIPACVLTGQAAGTAAALAAARDCTVQALPVPALQETLAAAGVKLHMDDAVRGNTAIGP
jgi:hypothetical protein